MGVVESTSREYKLDGLSARSIFPSKVHCWWFVLKKNKPHERTETVLCAYYISDLGSEIESDRGLMCFSPGT